ncbi:hypothetical protein HDU85_000417 [Gaertneriomyces sp. JEL0708]|nr:hypothetical protein HDU85_000417 [Gaertneriomyces sp. JEL0708]
MSEPFLDVEECLKNPREVAHLLLTDRSKSVQDVQKMFEEAFKSPEDLAKIPSLNNRPPQSLLDGSLVRFRCMIQDNSFNAQDYLMNISMKNHISGEEIQVSTVFCDDVAERPGFVPLEPTLAVHFSPSNLGEKYPVFCVAIPGETQWVRHKLHVNDHRYDDDALSASMNGLSVSSVLDPPILAKLPLPHHPHSTAAAMVKTYGADGQLQLNEVIEVIGIFEQPTAVSQDDEVETNMGQCNEFSLPPDGAEQPFFSTVPKVHALFHKRLSLRDMHPLVRDSELAKELLRKSDIMSLRSAVIHHLSTYLMGDHLAAEYLFLHLLSRIQHRAIDETPVGFFPLNICGCPSTAAQPEFAPSLAHLISNLVPRFHKISLGLKKLNEETWMVPAQGRERSDNLDIGVSAGELQLADGTHVLVEEMTLEDGVLNERGVQNIAHLSDIIQTAKLPYIIRFGEMSRNIDLAILVLSQGRCMFPVECVVPLIASGDAPVPTPVPEDIIDAARTLLGLMPGEPYSVPEEFVNDIGKEFAAQRAADHAAGRPIMSNADLGRRLEVARLVVRSFGRTELDQECWEHAGTLEAERIQRERKLPERRKAAGKPPGVAAPTRPTEAGR